ncbi:MAG: hypothetical protein HY721_12770 [Planctomycetes bacterium]|nr:hypothetical protein [Planctomycetota bacterium]
MNGKMLQWPFASGIRFEGGGIDPAQARRQEVTAVAILERLASRPGVVLADEVGMGKTFVALAVAASAAHASSSPVVVMAPPNLMDKWERDLRRFRALCLPRDLAEREEDRLRFRRAASGAELLRCFDDPRERKAHIVLLANTALHRSERDPFVRLEAIRQAIRGKWGVGRLRRAVARFACDLLRSGSLRGFYSVISAAFDRMLFLTATPFQLGHRELLEVLRRFLAVRWSSMPPERSHPVIREELARLGESLDRAQIESLQLDRLWGDLGPEDVDGDVDVVGDGGAGSSWWQRLLAARPADGRLARVLGQYERTREALRAAQEHLRPWIIRHRRPREIEAEGRKVPRRDERLGRAIRDGVTHHRGLEIERSARFPFLLCARAQAVLSRDRNRRAYFAEGLASSYLAFLETSRGERPVDDTDAALEGASSREDLAWYLERVEAFIREGRVPHPKIDATAGKALELWLSGEKVLIFGHYRKTVRDLADRLRRGVEAEIDRLAREALRLPDEGAARRSVDRIVQRLQDKESPLRRRVREVLEGWVAARPGLTAEQYDKVIELLLGTLATPSFVVRNFPLDRQEVRSSLETGRPTAAQARDAAAAVGESLARRKGNRLAYRARVMQFLDHLLGDLASSEERDQVLDELLVADKDAVRHASGEVKQETRRRVLLGFNSPLLPEIVVASEVMAEGLDLHLDCRHVIHHDLSWNPSTLEQRTGRVDRLRCLAEAEGQPIMVYLPYLEGTADEKMFRVVTDRARWFQVVMGERYSVDERSTDRLEARVPFPEEAAMGLAFDLAVAEKGGG